MPDLELSAEQEAAVEYIAQSDNPLADVAVLLRYLNESASACRDSASDSSYSVCS